MDRFKYPQSPLSFADMRTSVDEAVLLRSGLHPLGVFLGPVIGCLAGIVVSVVMFQFPSLPVLFPISTLLVFPVLVIPLAYLNYRFTFFIVTSRRITIQIGWFTRRTFEMLLSQIESVSVEQNVVGRSFGFGTVQIRGTGGSVEPFKGIKEPEEFRRVATDAIEQSAR